MAIKKPPATKTVKSLTHEEAKRRNIPTAEYESVVEATDKSPIRTEYERRNRDLDPQLVWRGKDEQDASDLVVQAPPLYIQEKVHPKALIDDLLRDTRARAQEVGDIMPDLFADFNGIPKGADKTEFYRHDQNWSNRMILGDSLQVMASLAEREGLRGKVQFIYFDPPYGIKFNSNFQWSTTTRDVKDGNASHITREPEQVKAFRDTWRDGVQSYLTYLRDRLTVARDLLSDSGSIFVQIGDENVHRVRAILDEIFGEDNQRATITIKKTSGLSHGSLPRTLDYLLWYSKSGAFKYKQLFLDKVQKAQEDAHYSIASDGSYFRLSDLSGPFSNTASCLYTFEFQGKVFKHSAGRQWKTTEKGIRRLAMADRIVASSTILNYRRLLSDFQLSMIDDAWDDISGSIQSRRDPKIYVVQTSTVAIARCMLMTTDPGDLILDPTCGSGTTATVAEQWGRRWITIDTSRVALALARARVMGARYPFYLLADSKEGIEKEAELTRRISSPQAVHNSVRQGFVNERVPHVTLKSIANNSEIDVIWEKWSAKLDKLRAEINVALHTAFEEWEIPPEASAHWADSAKSMHAKWWEARIGRQREIDASIAAKAEVEYLYDKAYEDKKTVRVAGPFTVESISPHRVLGVGPDHELIDPIDATHGSVDVDKGFSQLILDNLKTAGVQQSHKEDKISFISLVGWPGELICAEGRYLEGGAETGNEKRAAIFVGPEFGTVSRTDLVAAAREASDTGFDVLIACGFNYEAHTTEFVKLGRLPVLKARMNADLHMSGDLKKTDKANLFVVFGEPDIDLLPQADGQLRVKINGVDVFHPNTGEVRSDGPDGIACWFIDTDYNEESFFVRHAYFLGANDPYNALKTTLKTEIDVVAWATLNSDTSRDFPKPTTGRIAVKVINHLGDEVLKVFKVA